MGLETKTYWLTDWPSVAMWLWLWLVANIELVGELVSYLDNRSGSIVVICCCEKLVAETGDTSGTQSKGNVRRWKPIPSNGSEDVTVDTNMCVCNSEL
jgi:hypothetical protein